MTPANPDALADALNREPVELADDVTPQEVMRLALDGIDLAYRAHGNNARVSMLAVQADWIMQHLARTEMWAKDEQAKRHAAEDRLVEVRSRAAAAEARAAQLQAEVEAKDRALKDERARRKAATQSLREKAAALCDEAAAYFDRTTGHYDRTQAAGGYRATASKIRLLTPDRTALAARAATAREG